MLNRILISLGIDPIQWRALVKTSIKVDVFTSMMAGQAGGTTRRYWHPAFTAILVYGFISIFLAVAVVAIPIPFFSAMIVISVAMFMVASMVLLEYHSVVISPDDFDILAYRPVDSRTFFWSRIANVMFYTMIMTLSLGLLPTMAFVVDIYNDFAIRPHVSLVFLVSLVMSSMGISLAAVLGYAVVIAYVHPKRLRSWLAYGQMLGTFAFMGLFWAVPQLMRRDDDIQQQIEGIKGVWILLYPPAWFASIVELSSGAFTLLDGASALLGLIMFAWLIRLATGSISLNYSERLALLNSQSNESESTEAVKSRKTRWKNPEWYVVWMLTKRHFMNDMKFKIAILGLLPLIGFYMLMAFVSGTISDPFSTAERNPMDQSHFLLLALFMMPAMIKMNMSRSDHYHSSWLFFTTPTTREKLVVAMKNIVTVMLLLPLLLLFTAIYLVYFETWTHVALHMVLVTLFSYLFLQIGFLVDPTLPFSLPYKKGERFNVIIFVSIMFPMLMTMMGMTLIRNFIYVDLTRYGIFISVVAAVVCMLEWALRKRITRASKALQYID